MSERSSGRLRYAAGPQIDNRRLWSRKSVCQNQNGGCNGHVGALVGSAAVIPTIEAGVRRLVSVSSARPPPKMLVLM